MLSLGQSNRGETLAEPHWLGRCHADSVFVWDLASRRVVVFDAQGKFARAFTQPTNLASVSCSPASTLALLIAPNNQLPPRPTGDAPRRFSQVELTDSRGDAIAVIKPVPFFENRPLGRGTFVSIADGRAFIGTADSGFVDVYSLRGDPLGSFRIVNYPRRSPTSEQYYNAIDQLAAGFLTDADRERARRYLRRIPPPKVLPPYFGLYGSPDGTVWARTSAVGDSQTVLSALTSTGRYRGSVSIPFDMTVLDIGEGYILGAYEHKEREQRAVLYKFATRR